MLGFLKSRAFRIYIIPGAVFQSVMVGGGYGTGREIVEYFTAYGFLGGLLGILVSYLLLTTILILTFEFARKFKAFDYRHFFKGLLGRAWVSFEILIILQFLLVLAVLASAAGNILNDTLNLPYVAGLLLMLMAAVAISDVLVTCTPATGPLVQAEWLAEGTFVAAVGADSPGKQELDPKIIADHKVVADILHQVVRVGESQHAIAAGLISSNQIYAELGDIVCGNKVGRQDDSEIIVFDSTGTALQDVAAAAHLYERSQENTIGSEFNLFG